MRRKTASVLSTTIDVLKTGCAACPFMVLSLSIAMVPAFGAVSPEKTISSFLRNNYPWSEIDVQRVRVMGELSEGRPAKIRVERGPLGRAVFSFYYESGERLLVRAKVNAFGQVLKSRRPLRRGHVLRREDLYSAKVDVRKMPIGAVKDPGKILGKSLSRSVSANLAIEENMVEESEVVKRGKRVKLVIENEGFSITAAGKTMEKGYVGKPVRTINISSKKRVVGILIDKNTVKVEI